MSPDRDPPLRTGGTARLWLEPLEPRHAAEMVGTLAAPELYEHTGGTAPGARELADRYARLTAGSPDPHVRWCNWILRARDGDQAVGYVQATLETRPDAEVEAELAWVVGARWQRRGYATEAARWLMDEVRRLGASSVVARIAPANVASATVARRLGLQAGAVVEGEREWVAGPGR